MTDWITVKGTPRPQPRPRARCMGKHATVYTPRTAKVHEWRKAVRKAVKAAIDAPYEGPVVVSLFFYMPRPKKMGKGEFAPYTKRPDCDNLMKAVWDACDGVAWLDDAQIVECRAQKHYTAPGNDPCVMINISHW